MAAYGSQEAVVPVDTFAEEAVCLRCVSKAALRQKTRSFQFFQIIYNQAIYACLI